MQAGDENKPGIPVSGAFARAFGSSPADLDLDFTGLPRPMLVTELLRLCLEQPGTGSDACNEIWSWTLPQRSRALIAVALASGDRRLESHVRCRTPACGAMIELDVELAALIDRNETRSFEWSPERDRTLDVALPTGEDQKEWLSRGETTPRALARQLVKSVDGRPPANDWEVPDLWIDGLAAELEQRDPLTTLELDARCPACGAGLNVEFYLESELLKRFVAHQTRILRHVHRLASVYHWSEAEILSLPAWRRSYYLSQLEGL
jgi:hypothetical protein